jgi:hypothetical protein
MLDFWDLARRYLRTRSRIPRMSFSLNCLFTRRQRGQIVSQHAGALRQIQKRQTRSIFVLPFVSIASKEVCRKARKEGVACMRLFKPDIETEGT